METSLPYLQLYRVIWKENKGEGDRENVVKRREERNKKRTQRNVKSVKQNFNYYCGIRGHILGEAWYLQLQRLCSHIPKKEAASCYETSVHIHKSTRRHVPEELNPSPHSSENLQSRKKQEFGGWFQEEDW